MKKQIWPSQNLVARIVLIGKRQQRSELIIHEKPQAGRQKTALQILNGKMLPRKKKEQKRVKKKKISKGHPLQIITVGRNMNESWHIFMHDPEAGPLINPVSFSHGSNHVLYALFLDIINRHANVRRPYDAVGALEYNLLIRVPAARHRRLVHRQRRDHPGHSFISTVVVAAALAAVVGVDRADAGCGLEVSRVGPVAVGAGRGDLHLEAAVVLRAVGIRQLGVALLARRADGVVAQLLAADDAAAPGPGARALGIRRRRLAAAADVARGCGPGAAAVAPGGLEDALEQGLEAGDGARDDGHGDLGRVPYGDVARVPEVVALQAPLGQGDGLDDPGGHGEEAQRQDADDGQLDARVHLHVAEHEDRQRGQRKVGRARQRRADVRRVDQVLGRHALASRDRLVPYKGHGAALEKRLDFLVGVAGVSFW